MHVSIISTPDGSLNDLLTVNFKNLKFSIDARPIRVPYNVVQRKKRTIGTIQTKIIGGVDGVIGLKIGFNGHKESAH